tara:strand:+ start:3963 stop:4403 length:441 start_codon:yes stop_codon:yes gene_type:complete
VLLTKLTALFSGTKATSDETPLRALELSCAALMFEVARSDFTIDETERESIRLLLTENFALSGEDVATVTEEAADNVDAATCLFEFTRTINDIATVDQKRQLLTMMWRVALADDALSRYEEHVIRKVADLLYLPHNDFMLAKQRAR